MWIIDLPRVGSADDPTPCLGDARFTTARSARTVRDCQAICGACHWQEACHQLATALVDQGEPITGIWAGVNYGADNERDDRRGNVDDRSGHGHRPLVDHPPRVVWLVGSSASRPDNGPPAELPGIIPRQRTREPW